MENLIALMPLTARLCSINGPLVSELCHLVNNQTMAARAALGSGTAKPK